MLRLFSHTFPIISAQNTSVRNPRTSFPGSSLFNLNPLMHINAPETSMEGARCCSDRAAGKAPPGPSGGLGGDSAAPFHRISRKEASESPTCSRSVPAAESTGRRRAARMGNPITPQFGAGATAPRAKEALAPGRTPSLLQPGGSGRAQAPTRARSPRSPRTTAQGLAGAPAFEGQGGCRHFNLLRAGPQQRGSG